MFGRHLALLLRVYVSLDFANPFMPGAVSFESGLVEAARAVRRRILPSVRHEMPSLDPASPDEDH